MAFALAAGALLAAGPGTAEAKVPGQKHCHGGVCHRVMTIAETASAVGKPHRITASHYDDCRRDRFNPCGLTSSGEIFRPHMADNTASSIHPDGTVLLLRNPGTKLAAVVRVNNFGPFKKNRQLDVSRATAEKLGFAASGVASLEVMVVHAPTAAEARYQRKRRYEPVPGFIGHTPSVDSAYLQYAELTQKQRVARLDTKACQVARNHPTPQLGLIAAAAAGVGVVARG